MKSSFHRIALTAATVLLTASMAFAIEVKTPDIKGAAKANGLLESARLGSMLEDELRRRKSAQELGIILQDIRDQPGDAMTAAEIEEEIKAARLERISS